MNEKSPRETSIKIVEADLDRTDHQEAVVQLIDAYAQDPVIQSQPITQEVRRALIPGLQKHPTTLVLIAYCDIKAIGVAVCFLGFSTFAAKPLVNIHDFAVLPQHRGQGVGRMLLQAVERKARDLGCCKVTLEVLESNVRARRIYQQAGFGAGAAEERGERFLFLSKPLK